MSNQTCSMAPFIRTGVLSLKRAFKVFWAVPWELLKRQIQHFVLMSTNYDNHFGWWIQHPITNLHEENLELLFSWAYFISEKVELPSQKMGSEEESERKIIYFVHICLTHPKQELDSYLQDKIPPLWTQKSIRTRIKNRAWPTWGSSLWAQFTPPITMMLGIKGLG